MSTDLARWPLPRKHLSASALSTFATCPEQFRRGYIQDDWRPSAPPLVLGGAVHAGLDYALTTKMRTGELPPLSEAQGHVDFAMDRAIADDDVQWGSTTPGAVRARAATLYRAYHERVAPELRPLAVEHQFELQVAGVPVPIRGKIDVLDERFKLEVKTGAQTAKVIKPQWRLQGLVYLLVDDRPVHWHSLAELQSGVVIRRPGDRDPKTGEPETDLAMERTAVAYSAANAMIRSTVGAILAMHDRFGPDEPWPGALAHQWACGMCDHRVNGCVYWTARPALDLAGLLPA